MKLLLFIVLCVAVLCVGLAVYVRLAPVEAATWHVDPDTAADPQGRGLIKTIDSALAPQQALAALDGLIRATPRSTVVAGDVESAMITYEIRTKLMRYPDYVTVKAAPSDSGSTLTILSRARFGRSDLGVNGKRLDAWLKQLKTVEG